MAYVTAEWMSDNGEHDLAQGEMARFRNDLDKYSSKPREQRTYERQYSPLGEIL